MCGIAGIYLGGEGVAPPLRDTVRRMIAVQRDRGPDGSGIWSDGSAALGCARLRITGGPVTGAQPVHDRWGGVLVFNGEIYNPERVLCRLGEQQLAGASDGLALAAVLARRGPAGLGLIHGPFAAARFDPRTGRLLLVRDAVGKKPIYVTNTGRSWVFASTLRGLREAVGPLRVRPEAELEYLVYRSVGGCHSAFRGVEQVPPGGWLELAPAGARRGTWWTPPEPTEDEASGVQRVRARVSAAVRARIPEQPFAVFVSGGVDSAIVAAVAARSRRGPSPHLLTVSFRDGVGVDESVPAAELAADLGLPLHRVRCAATDVPDLLARVTGVLEDPVQDPVTVLTLALARAAAHEVRIVLTGDGSDEVWGGYDRFHEPPSRLDDYLPRTTIFEPAELGLRAAPPSYLDDIPLAGRELAPLDRIMRLEVSNRLRNYHLSRIDKILMSCAVEPRSPFLDRAVVELGLSLPAAAKISGGVPKSLLRRAFAGALPLATLRRPKRPFTAPVLEWLRGPLRDYARDTLTDRGAWSPHLVPGVQRLVAAVDGGSVRAAHQVWALLVYEVWRAGFVAGMERPRHDDDLR